MDVFKAQLDKIKQQLAGLTATQRMLVGTLVTIMVGTLLYWGHYAGNAEMTPLLDQALSAAEIGKINQALDLKGVLHTTTGDRVLVPADRKMELVADLMYSNQLPADLHSIFDEVNKNLNPFSTPTEREATYNQAREMMLSQILQRFPHVADAQVMINAKAEQRVESPVMPSASIILTLRDPVENPKPLVIACADSVAHAVSSLTRGHISVVVDGRSFPLTDAENDPLATGSELMDMKTRLETVEAQKIQNAFQFIPNLMVSVSVEVENRTTSGMSQTYDAANTLVKPLEENNKSQETSTPTGPGADPGVGANTGASISVVGAGSENSTSTITEDNNKNTVLPSYKTENVQTPAGKGTIQSATIRVPRSYMVGIFKELNPKIKDPSEAELQTFTTTQLASIRDGVKKAVSLKSDDDISVDTYIDLGAAGAMAMAAAPVAATSPIAGVTAYGKQIAVGALAIISLFMMSSMVRKATPAPIVAVPVEIEAPSVLSAGEGLAGEVGTTNATLDGMELDDDAVKTQQMLDQVSTMVKENPDGAAALVKRWLNRS